MLSPLNPRLEKQEVNDHFKLQRCFQSLLTKFCFLSSMHRNLRSQVKILFQGLFKRLVVVLSNGRTIRDSWGGLSTIGKNIDRLVSRFS